MVAWGSRGRLVPTPAWAAAADARLQVRSAAAASFLLAAGLVVGLASFDGGFYPRAWGWAGLAVCAVAAGRLVLVRRVELTPRSWLMLGALVLLLAWIGVTATRPDGATAAVPELERGGLYLAVLWALQLVVRNDTVAAALAGLLGGVVVVCSAGLALFLFPGGGTPDVYEGRLLFRPIGYANATGIFAGTGCVLALAFAAHGGSRHARALAAASLVLLAATLGFTGSRAAIASVVLAVSFIIAVDPLRRRFAATAAVTLPLPLLGVWAGSRTHVRDAQAATGVVAHDGRIVALLIVLLTVAAALVARIALADGPHARLVAKLGTLAAAVGALACAAVAAVAVSTSAAGSAGDRPAYWRAAWHDYLSHPLLGSGAGSFERAWLHYRATPIATIDAHNLYLETLAELGPLGLALLVAVLVVPLTAVARARRRDPFAVAAAGAYVAFLAHASFDWDWEMPAVTVLALVCGTATLKAASAGGAGAFRPGRWPVVSLAVVGTCGVAIALALGLVGNVALARSASAARAGDWASAQRLGRTAARWQPWSAEPYYLLGEAELAAGHNDAARQRFLEALDRDSQDWRTWYELARVAPASRQRAVFEIARLNPLAVRRAPG
jgi:tetratricopeptide (TPR) repeat protein